MISILHWVHHTSDPVFFFSFHYGKLLCYFGRGFEFWVFFLLSDMALSDVKSWVYQTIYCTWWVGGGWRDGFMPFPSSFPCIEIQGTSAKVWIWRVKSNIYNSTHTHTHIYIYIYIYHIEVGIFIFKKKEYTTLVIDYM